MSTQNKTPTTFYIQGNQLYLRCGQAGLDESRLLGAAEKQRFQSWLQDYHNPWHRSDGEQALLRLGRELYAWLDGSESWLARLRPRVVPPWTVEFIAPREPDGLATLFLQAPWELLADNQGYLAANPALRCSPVRRLGEPASPEPPSPYRLSLVFMAASPRGQIQLDYEAEETAILDATSQTAGLDLTVEESGTLVLLADCVSREAPVDVLHLSCHGRGEPKPALLLESDEGEASPVTAEELILELTAHRPRLLFLSACHTAESAELVDSLAVSLLRAGMAAVLGWDGPVGDAEATEFAATLYRLLARRGSLQEAVSSARFALLTRPAAQPLARPSRDWHLARLFLGATGGGPLIRGERARHRKGIEIGHKEFLDAKGQQIPVAGRREFVGRRRPIQAILRTLRSRDYAGVLIHGMGRQGKSSLAARVANRLEHDTVVVFKRYDAVAILEALRRFVGSREVNELVERYRDRVRQNPDELAVGLRELLEGPCREVERNDQGIISRRPVLLVLDDLEQILTDPGPDGLHRVAPDLVPTLRAVLETFAEADSDSRLLITSRFRFTLPWDGRDLADDLFDLHLPPMDGAEGRRQAVQKLKAVPKAKTASPDENLIQRCITVARGNPGLQDRLFLLSLEDPAACTQALEAMEAYLAGQEPDQETVREFLEDLAIEGLLGLLTKDEQELLRVSTLFQLPVPLDVLEILAESAALKTGDPCGRRLLALGLWEVYPDLVRYEEPAIAINALVHPRVGKLSENEARTLAGLALPPLFQCWGGEDGSRRPYLSDHELARLAGQAAVLRSTAQSAVQWLRDQLRNPEAADLARHAIWLLDENKEETPLGLLRVAGEVCVQVGDTPTARVYFSRALTLLHERLAVFQALGDAAGRANSLWSIAQIEIQKGAYQDAFPRLLESYQILLRLGLLEGIIYVGMDLGQFLCVAGQLDEGIAVLSRSRDGFRQLGRGGEAQQVQALIDAFSPADGQS